MIPTPKEMTARIFGIEDPDARLRFIAAASADAARLSDAIANLTRLAVDDKLQSKEPEADV